MIHFLEDYSPPFHGASYENLFSTSARACSRTCATARLLSQTILSDVIESSWMV